MEDQFNQSFFDKNKTVIIALGSFIVLAIVIIMIFFVIRMINESKIVPKSENKPPLVATTSTPNNQPAENPPSSLPAAGEVNGGDGQGGASSTEIVAQKINFGDYYQPIKEELELKPPTYDLPLNVKTDVANYYDVYRKMNLDAALDSLNNGGFALLDNPFSADAKNFYKMYSLLDAKGLPALVTSDFLLYYYQNILKQSYKEIEGSVFYDNLWETNKSLYKAAKDRYEKNLAQKGLVNDVSLEGSRLEAAYFATALILLAPTDKQILGTGGLSQNAGFSSAEADEFSFQLPSYLQDDVSREVKFIREAKETAKSPVLFYERDYTKFSVPAAYKNNARLNNFYLASSWLNSVFPLYYRGSACPNCLLDKEDWRINMFAAFLVAGDLSGDQRLQNRWAKIYKLQTFFGGLRNDLSYLDYQNTLNGVFPDKKVEDVLGGGSEEVDKNLAALQEKLAGIFFAPIEGGLDKTSTTTTPLFGMKMLVSAYAPDEYILNELVSPKVGIFLGSDKEAEKVVTACGLPNRPGSSRCSGSAFDIINLINPIGAGNSYFNSNSHYENYGEQVKKMNDQLAKFTSSSWHNRSYWANLDIIRKMLSAPEKVAVVFMKSAAWQAKDLNTALAAWANAELPADIFSPPESSGAALLGQGGGENPYAAYKYIEPNLTLSDELLANTKMIAQVLTMLKVGDGQNSVLSELETLQKNLESVRAIMLKELRGEDLSEEDIVFIDTFTKEFSVKEEGNKVLSLPVGVGGKVSLKEDISGIKLLIIAYQHGDKKFFVVGPVFSFQEKK